MDSQMLFARKYQRAARAIIFTLTCSFIIGCVAAYWYEVHYVFEKGSTLPQPQFLLTVLRSLEGGIEGVVYLTLLTIMVNQWQHWRTTTQLIGFPSWLDLRRNLTLSAKSRKYQNRQTFWSLTIKVVFAFGMLYFIVGFTTGQFFKLL
jgi:hypothetical protein